MINFLKIIFLNSIFLMNFSIRADNRMVEIGGLDWSPFYSFENDQLTGGLCTELLEKLLTELKIPYHKKGY